MDKKHAITLFATAYALIFTTLTFAVEDYYRLWMSFQVIILPLIYGIGYQILMKEQESNFQEAYSLIKSELDKLRNRKVKKQIAPM